MRYRGGAIRKGRRGVRDPDGDSRAGPLCQRSLIKFLEDRTQRVKGAGVGISDELSANDIFILLCAVIVCMYTVFLALSALSRRIEISSRDAFSNCMWVVSIA